MKTWTIFALLSLFLVTSVQAQTWTLSGQLRHRSEIDSRDFTGVDDRYGYHLLRTRLGVAVKPLPDLTAFIQIQDARNFGGENPALGRGTMDASADQLDLHQAYFQVDNLFDSPLAVRVGRQELSYGNERLIGVVAWANSGRSFDGGVLKLRTDAAAVDVFAAQLVDVPGEPAGQNLYGVWSVWSLAEGHDLEAFVLLDNNTSETTGGPDEGEDLLFRYTPGLYLHGAASGLDYGIEAYYQGGKISESASEPRQDIRAHLLSAAAGYTFDAEASPRLGALYTRLSGDSEDDDTYKTFNTLFAANHAFYGFMDYFPALLNRYGLQDFALSAGAGITEKLRLGLDFHHFMTAASVELSDGSELNVIGQEFDLTASYRYNQHFSIVGGASTFLPREAVETMVGDEQTYWFYLMTVVSF